MQGVNADFVKHVVSKDIKDITNVGQGTPNSVDMGAYEYQGSCLNVSLVVSFSRQVFGLECATHNVGNTQFGKRRPLDISGGTITGDKLNGTVMTGGLDYELTLSNGAMELEEVLILQTSDTTIFARVCGVAAAGDSTIRIVPDFEAPTSGSAAWLNTTGKFLSSPPGAGSGGVSITFSERK